MKKYTKKIDKLEKKSLHLKIKLKNTKDSQKTSMFQSEAYR